MVRGCGFWAAAWRGDASVQIAITVSSRATVRRSMVARVGRMVSATDQAPKSPWYRIAARSRRRPMDCRLQVDRLYLLSSLLLGEWSRHCRLRRRDYWRHPPEWRD